jgi:lysophospholipase L1-like esterase
MDNFLHFQRIIETHPIGDTHMKTTFRSLLILLSFIGSTLTSFAQAPPKFTAPKDYVLVLGDSLAFGYQEAKFQMTQDPANFTTGFADDFTRFVRNTPPGKNTTLVNLGCPGETTRSLLTESCAFHTLAGFRLHVDYDGAQIGAAEAFLAAHPGQVGPILIAIGANDVFAVSDQCGGLNTACFAQLFPSLVASLSTNYSAILDQLRRAAPDAEIITLGFYNPFAIVDPVTNLVVEALDQLVQNISAANRAYFANPFVQFNLVPPQPQTLCMLSLVCLAPLNDIHPTDAGYQVITNVMWAVSGYTRFQH